MENGNTFNRKVLNLYDIKEHMYPVYYLRYGTNTTFGGAVVAAESRDEAYSLLEKTLLSFGKILRITKQPLEGDFVVNKEKIKDTGFKSDKKGVLFPFDALLDFQ